MAVLPSAGSATTVGVLIETAANDTGIVEAKAGLESLKASGSSATSSLGKSFSDFGSSIGKVGQSLLPLSAGIVAIGGYSIKAAMDFQTAMTQIQTQAGASAAEVNNLNQKVLDLSTAVGETPQQLAKGLFYIESAGYRGAQAMDMLKLASEGAQVGGANLDDTAKGLAATINTNIKGAQSASEAMGNLNAIVGAGMMHFQDLNGAIGTGFLATASQFGVSLQSAGAALADLTRQGMPAEQSATRLRMAMVLMSTPTAQAANVLKGLGFNVQDAQGATQAMTDALGAAHVTTTQLSDDLRKPNGFLVAVEDLKKHLMDSGLNADAADAAIAKAFGGGRSSGPLMAFLANTNSLADSFKTIQKNSNAFGDDFAKRQQDAQFKWDQFKATLSKDAVELGQSLLPKVTTAISHIANAVQDATRWWNGLGPTAKTVITDIALALAVGAPLLIGVSKVISAVQNIGSVMVASFKLGQKAISKTDGMIQGLADVFGVSSIAMVGSMAVVAAAVLAVVGAISAAISMYNAWNDAVNKGQAGLNAQTQVQDRLNYLMHNGTPQQKADAKKQLIALGKSVPYAAGTSFAAGGWSVVGENGPELVNLPRGSQVLTNSQSTSMHNSGNKTSISIGQVVLSSPDAVNEFFEKLNRDTQLTGMGLSPASGLH